MCFFGNPIHDAILQEQAPNWIQFRQESGKGKVDNFSYTSNTALDVFRKHDIFWSMMKNQLDVAKHVPTRAASNPIAQNVPKHKALLDGKIRTRKTPLFGHFSRNSRFSQAICKLPRNLALYLLIGWTITQRSRLFKISTLYALHKRKPLFH